MSVKLVWFVPRRGARRDARRGLRRRAGRIGNYERCSWYTAGTGTFSPARAPSPPRPGRPEERVADSRRDGRPRRARRGRRRGARAAHPYEEVAFDLYPLRREGAPLHRRRRAGQPRPGRLRLRDRGRRRHGARRAEGEAIGVATNNVAEYRGLIAGLERAVELGVAELEVVSDSELLVKQMTGEYRVKNEALRELSRRGRAARAAARQVRYAAVRRSTTSSPTAWSTRRSTAPEPAAGGILALSSGCSSVG